MAWESGHTNLSKKNGKFESFLKRSLSDEVFERVRAYESCIIVAESEKRTFKYVVLCDEKLYLTENPPKTLQEVVHLKDIVSVELVNEYPNFLAGKEKVNTQHIAVTYITTQPKRSSFRRTKKSPRGSMSDLSENRSNASTPVSYVSSIDGNFAEELGNLTKSTTSIPRSSSWDSLKTGIPKKKRKPTGVNDSLDHVSILRSLKEELEEDKLDDSKNDRMGMIKSAGKSWKNTGGITLSAASKSRSMLALSQTLQNGRDRAEGDRKLVENGFSMNSSAVSSSQQSLKPLPPVQMTKSSSYNNDMRKSITSSGKTEVDVVDIKSCCSFFRSKRERKSQIAPANRNIVPKLEPLDQMHKGNGLSSIQSNLHGGSQQFIHQEGLGSRISLAKDTGRCTPLLGDEYKLNGFNASFTDLGRSSSSFGLSTLSVDGVTERRKCVLNIYLLNLDSPLLFFITSAWNNYMIRSTQQLEPQQFDIIAEPIALRNSSRDKVERKYNQLKRDLLQPHHSLEEQYALVDQLFSITKANNTLKKFFWKNSDILSFLIAQLQKYLPKSSAAQNTDEGKFQRADEIEFAILVLSTVNLMLRETEILPCRLQTLKLEGGKHVLNLLKILIFQPEFPFRPLTLTKHWSTPVAEKKLDLGRNVDEELARLKTEFVHVSIASVFELILVAKQVPAEETRILTVTGMISILHDMKAVEMFTDCLLSQIMELVTLTRFDLLSPIQALLVFQMFSLLFIFLEHSTEVVYHIRNKYYEEFKYFIQAPAVSRKLSPQYPITQVTISIVNQVVVKVLRTPPLNSSRNL